MLILGLLWLSSCMSWPEPSPGQIPEITDVGFVYDSESVLLYANVEGAEGQMLDCGFMYGKDDDTMVTEPAFLEGDSFTLRIHDFDYDTLYHYKAFVSNGVNYSYSSVRQFFIEKEQVKIPKLTLSEETVCLPSGGGSVTVQVSGNVDFDVDIPDGAGWLSFSLDGNICCFEASANSSGDTYQCEVVFRGRNCGIERVLTVIQEAEPVSEPDPIPEIQYEIFTYLPVSYHNHLIQLYASKNVTNVLDMCLRTDRGDHWEYWVWVSENTASEQRSIELRISVSDTTSDIATELSYPVIQKSYYDIVEFKCPVVKQSCVEQFDADGDSELSFYEIGQLTKLTRGCFQGLEITSFEEFRHFLNISEIPDFAFAGSSLESIVLPLRNQISPLMMGEGAFLDCFNLKNINLNSFCPGKRSFSGCTSLEEAIVYWKLPDQLFKGCTALRKFVFDGDLWGTAIGEEVFYGCSSLPEVTLPKQVTEIGSRAFYGCSGLTALYMSSPAPPVLGEDVFYGVSDELQIYVPAPAVNSYRKNWSEVADHIVPFTE